MSSTDRQVNSSLGIPALEKLWLARWSAYDLAIFGLPLIAAIVAPLLFTCRPWCYLAVVPLVFLLWLISFFRNPPRQIPSDPGVIVSPADGTVTDITPLAHYDFIGGPAVRVGIFLSIFNVHINRAPLAAVVELHYKPGEFLNAMNPASSERNEFMWIGFEETSAPYRRFAVRQISGLLARRIVCPLRLEQIVTQGEIFGMIKLGSRTELILPAAAADILVKPGDLVRAGSHIVARWH